MNISKAITAQNRPSMQAGPRNKQKRKKNSNPNKVKGRNNRQVMVRPPSIVMPQTKFRLADCSQNYLKALTNPFQELSDVCTPDQHELPSWKFPTLLRGIMTVGSQGLGYALAGAITQSHDSPSVIFTNGSFVTSSITTDTSTAGVVASNDDQFPYTTAQVTGNALTNCRVVASAIRMRYISSEIKRGGQFLTYRTVTTAPWHNGATSGEIFSNQTTVPYPNNRQWVGVCHQPAVPQDYDYDAGSHQIVPATGQNANLAIIVTGAEVGTQFEWEFIKYHELIPVGNQAIPGLTASHVDMDGLSAIKDVLQTSLRTPSESYYSSAYKAITQLTPDDVSGFVSSVKSGLAFAKLVA